MRDRPLRGGVGIGPGHELARNEAGITAAGQDTENLRKVQVAGAGIPTVRVGDVDVEQPAAGSQQALLNGWLLDVGVEGVEEQAQVVGAHAVDQLQPLAPRC